jgi:hypothetical protein
MTDNNSDLDDQLDEIATKISKMSYSYKKIFMLNYIYKYLVMEAFIINNINITKWTRLSYFELSQKLEELKEKETEIEQTKINEFIENNENIYPKKIFQLEARQNKNITLNGPDDISYQSFKINKKWRWKIINKNG